MDVETPCLNLKGNSNVLIGQLDAYSNLNFKVRECDAARKICSESKIKGYFAGSSDVITFTNLPWNKDGCKRTSVYCKCRKTQR